MAVKHSRRAVVGTIGSLALAPGILALSGTATPVEAAPAESADLIFIVADVVQGTRGVSVEDRPMKGCVPTARFPRNSQMVFRARIYDPLTGEKMTGDAIEVAEVKLANGVALPMRFGPHSPPVYTDEFWTASWVVPKDYPTGTLLHSIVATAADGRTGEYTPLNIPASTLTIIEEVMPDPET